MSVQTVSSTAVAHALTALRANRPLVHCLTNEVVQEITANVLLAAGASPAMVVAMEEAPVFTAISGALLINTGTPYPERVAVMKACAQAANDHGVPWVLDPVAAGATPWRTQAIRELLALKPFFAATPVRFLHWLVPERAARASTAQMTAEPPYLPLSGLPKKQEL